MTAEPPPLQNIVLIGFMGAGKSSIGRRVAGQLGYRFIDTDQLIVERAGAEITEIFARHGEMHFRDLESSVLASLAEQDHRVIATGGGIVLRESNRALLRRLGFVVGLDAKEEVIFERVSRNRRRPLLQTADPRATITRMLAERRPLYTAAAQWTIDTSELTHSQIAARIVGEAERAFSWQAAE